MNNNKSKYTKKQVAENNPLKMLHSLENIFSTLKAVKGDNNGDLSSNNNSSVVSKIEWVIAGLGNIGKSYNDTRHNAGFSAIDSMAEAQKIEIKKIRFDALTAEGSIANKRCIFIKPTTFMNRSGESIEQVLSYYKLPPERLLVLYDDISLPPGKLRIRRNGSAGGHNGIKSIISCLDTQDFPRIKIGVGAKPHPEYDLADWVLSRFSESEKKQLDDIFPDLLSATEYIIKGDIATAMSRFN